MRFRREKQTTTSEVVPRTPRPTGVTVLGVMGFLTSIALVVLAGFTFIFAGLFNLASSNLNNLANQGIGPSGNNSNVQNVTGPIFSQINGAIKGLGQGFGVAGTVLGVLGVILLVGMLLTMLTSWGLYTGRNWARYLTILFLVIETVASILLIGGSFLVGALSNIFYAELGILIIGSGWLVTDIYLIYYLLQKRVASYFKPQKLQVPITQSIRIPAPTPPTQNTPPQAQSNQSKTEKP